MSLHPSYTHAHLFPPIQSPSLSGPPTLVGGVSARCGTVRRRTSPHSSPNCWTSLTCWSESVHPFNCLSVHFVDCLSVCPSFLWNVWLLFVIRQPLVCHMSAPAFVCPILSLSLSTSVCLCGICLFICLPLCPSPHCYCFLHTLQDVTVHIQVHRTKSHWHETVRACNGCFVTAVSVLKIM